MDWLDKAIRKAGGYAVVAEISGVSEHHLRNAGSGRRGIGRDSIAKLRPHLRVAEKRWNEALMAPRPRRATATDTDSATTA